MNVSNQYKKCKEMLKIIVSILLLYIILVAVREEIVL